MTLLTNPRTHSTNPKMSRARVALVAAAFGLALMAASAVQAFTFESGGPTSNDASAMRFGTGDSRFSTNSSPSGANSSPAGRSGFSSGNSSLQFGGQSSFSQRYNSDRMFDSNSILGKDR
jgi:hypothetical protein